MCQRLGAMSMGNSSEQDAGCRGPQGVAANKPLPPDAAGPPTRLCFTLMQLDAQLKQLDAQCRAVLRYHAHAVHFASPRCYEIVDGAKREPSAEMLRAWDRCGWWMEAIGDRMVESEVDRRVVLTGWNTSQVMDGDPVLPRGGTDQAR